jgi:hypothetical protein
MLRGVSPDVGVAMCHLAIVTANIPPMHSGFCLMSVLDRGG